MKRSKIFLGVTTALLAVVGVAAAKQYSATGIRWYVTALHGQYCNGLIVPCEQSGFDQCFGTYTNGVAPHTRITNGILYTVGSFDALGHPKLADANNCQVIVRYSAD